MRLWHKDMVQYLPQQQLISQWRECCCIGVLLAKNHTPNHILVNPILDYPPEHFQQYCHIVFLEMLRRNYSIADKSVKTLEDNLRAWVLYLEPDLPWDWKISYGVANNKDIFKEWHTKRYFKQCYYNLEEKYDRGGIPEKEWTSILHFKIYSAESEDQ